MMRSFCDTSPQAMPLIVTLDGQLDLFNREETRRKLRRLALSLNGIVDLRTARFGDATGLGDLAAVRQASSERGGTIVLVASDSWMLRVLNIVHFDALFPIVSTLSEAHNIIASKQRG